MAKTTSIYSNDIPHIPPLPSLADKRWMCLVFITLRLIGLSGFDSRSHVVFNASERSAERLTGQRSASTPGAMLKHVINGIC